MKRICLLALFVCSIAYASTQAVSVSTRGSLRSDFNGETGLYFVPSSAEVIESLCREVVAGNSLTHDLKLYDDSGSTTPLATVNINTSGQTAGAFTCGAITPYTLTPGTGYYVLSAETNGGDQWRDDTGTSVTLLTAFGSLSSGYRSGGSFATPTPSKSYGPVGFIITGTGGGFPGGGGSGGSVSTATNAITIHNTTGSTVNQPYTISRVFKRGEIANYPKPSGFTEWQSDVKTRWPDGSVQHALISFWRSTATGTADEILFVNSTDACHLGNEATCTAAGLDGAGMLAFDTGTRGAGIVATAFGGSASVTRNVRTMISNGDFTYWIRGPIATIPIVEDRTTARSYDFGWTSSDVLFPVNTVDLSADTFPVAADWAEGNPVRVYTAGTAYAGAVNTTSGSATVTWSDRSKFNTSWPAGMVIKIGSIGYTIASVASDTSLTLAELATSTATQEYTATDGPAVMFPESQVTSAYVTAAVTVVGSTKTVTAVTGTFDTAWPHNYKVRINGSWYTVNAVGSTTSLTVNETISDIAVAKNLCGMEKATYLRDFYTDAGNGLFLHKVSSTVGQFRYQSSTDALDFVGTGSLTAPSNMYGVTNWVTDSTYKSLHPQIIQKYYPGWAGVYNELVMQNGWTTAIQDQAYTAVFKTGSTLGTTVATKFVTHPAMTEYVYRFWDGTPTTFTDPSTATIFTAGAPTTFWIDPNMPYWIASKVLPNHDTTIDVTSYVSTEYAFFTDALTGAEPFYNPMFSYQYGSYRSNIQDYGGRAELGLNPRNFMRYLWSGGDPQLYMAVLGNADIAGTTPYHIWESDTGRYFDSAHTIDAFGKPLSLDSRPTFRIGHYPDLTKTGTVLADQAQPIGAFNTVTGWIPEYNASSWAHQANYSYIPYLLTGDYFYLEDYQAITATSLSRVPPDITQNQRHGSWGVTPISSEQTRGVAWGLRTLGDVTFMTPDAMDEKAYFLQKLNNNLAVLEAQTNITDGHFYASCNADTFDETTETNPYCWALYGSGDYPNPLHLPLSRLAHPGSLSPDGASDDAMWQGSCQIIVFGHLAELGFQTDVLARETSTLHVQYATSTLGVRTGWAAWELEDAYVPVVKLSDSTPTTLATSINSTDLMITVAAAQPWMSNTYVPFYIQFMDVADHDPTEKIRICSVSGNDLTVCSTGRGRHGTTAISHASGLSIRPIGSGVGPNAGIGPFVRSLADVYAMVPTPLPNEDRVVNGGGGCYAHSTEWASMLDGTLPTCWVSSTDPEFGYAILALSALSFSGNRTAYQTIYDLFHAADNTSPFVASLGNPKFFISPRSTALPSSYFRGLTRVRGGVSTR